jgi:hypothetical protein
MVSGRNMRVGGRIIGLRNRWGAHFYTDADGFFSLWSEAGTGCIFFGGSRGGRHMKEGRGHTGTCRPVKRFRDKEIEQVARSVEARYEGRFEPHGAKLAVLPEQISHLRSVGEGVELHLFPANTKTWPHWGRFESDVEARRRPRMSGAWERTMSLQDVERWLQTEAENYLLQLTS